VPGALAALGERLNAPSGAGLTHCCGVETQFDAKRAYDDKSTGVPTLCVRFLRKGWETYS